MNLAKLFRKENRESPLSSSLPKIFAAKPKSTRRKLSRLRQVESLEARQMLTATVEMIDVNLNGLGSFPGNFIELNGELRFSANGTFYTTDGTSEGTVPIDADSPLSGIFSPLTDVNGTSFFNGFTNRTDLQPGLYAGDNELWKTDGTLAGTVLVKDIYPGASPTPYGSDAPNSSSPYELTNVGGTLFFAASEADHGRELWKSDGTEQGTVLVKDIRTIDSPDGGPGSSFPSNLTNVDGTLFFVADDGVHGRELWTSDGTDAGTVLLADINVTTSEDGSVAYGSDPANLINVNGTLFFTANDGVGGVELWKSDGTDDGTSLVKDIGPDAVSSSPAWLTAINGNLFFTADDSVHGREMWRTDGTEDGTAMVHDVNPGEASSSPANLFNVNDSLLVFSADDGTNGAELWQSDGTADGTTFIRDINPGAAGSAPQLFLNANGTLYFQADDGPAHGIELWKTDGTLEGTQIAGDFWPGPTSSRATPLYDASGTIYVRADVNPYGVELWKTDGTETGVELVKDIRLGNWGSTIGETIDFNGTLYFSADTCPGCIDFELWTTDGTQAGTHMVKNINPVDRQGSSPRSLTVVGDNLYFTASNATDGSGIWKTDGTDEGTALFRRNAARPTSFDGDLFFTSRDDEGVVSLLRSDGNEGGTVMIAEPGPSYNLTVVEESLYFVASQPEGGYSLWESDGTATGTAVVKDVIAPTSYLHPLNASMVDLNGTLFFAGDDGTNGTELWKSDGTVEGTGMIKDINPGTDGALYDFPNAKSLTNVDGTLYFVANDGATGSELWKSDGTEAGTMLVKDIRPGDCQHPYYPDVLQPCESRPDGLANFGGHLFFFADDGTNGRELWTSDGTEAGTVLVKDLNPGSASSIRENASNYGRSLANVNGMLYFSADDGVHGAELWRSDGTAAGTELFAEIVDGPMGGDPARITLVNNNLYFGANADGFQELFKIDLSTLEPLQGDFTGDGKLDVADIDALSAAVRDGANEARFDLNDDGDVNQEDRRIWVEEIMKTWFGDADLDGQFTTHDLVLIFQRGQYEDGVPGNASWADGDFNGDGEFDSGDLVAAWQGGGYLKGRRA